METKEKVSFFIDLINCNYTLHYWIYTADFKLVETNWKNDLFSSAFFDYVGFPELIFQHQKENLSFPLILEAESNLLWIAGFEIERQNPKQIYLIGPILGGKDTHLFLHRKLASYDLSPKLSHKIKKTFENIPAIPSNILLQYAVMLHYCLNLEQITIDDVIYKTPMKEKTTPPASFGGFPHAGIWVTEQLFCKMLSEGNPDYKKVLQKSHSISSGVRYESTNAMRYNQNNCIVLLTLCSRACIKGGLSPEIAYDLNDYYAEKIENCNSITALGKLSAEMLEDYVRRVREVKKNISVSNMIRNACEYIRSHITEELSIKELAKRAGYTEYYFSHKFKQEIGISVNHFISNEKIEYAKLLLSGTTESIQSISDTLSFVNRSYFYTCFRKVTGMSPSEYRRRTEL